jgi:hypothetical protein
VLTTYAQFRPRETVTFKPNKKMSLWGVMKNCIGKVDAVPFSRACISRIPGPVEDSDARALQRASVVHTGLNLATALMLL